MEKFTVKGVEGSYAQGYCGEHEHVEFQAVEMPTEAAKNSGNDNKSDTGTENRFKKAAVLGGAALGGCAVIALLVLLIRKLTGKGASVKDTSEKSVPENDMGKDEVTVEEPSEQAGQDGKSEEKEQ